MRLSRALYFGLLGLLILRFVTHLSSLPPVVASHFGPGGQPDGWMSRGVFAVFGLLPVVVSLIVVVAAPLMTARLPASMINLPNKDYWLTPERRAQAFSKLAAEMEWFGAGLVAFFIFTYELVFIANQNGAPLAEGPFLVGLLVFFAGAIYSVYRTFKAFEVPEGP
ncbi:MAG: DUF1648 domain-containing protein [Deltaproteobacteria bacterium]|jgi:uncharacterized membrane protein|nr:DUF1648 domain-containing protein [Deltaproteobacteria bacterium]